MKRFLVLALGLAVVSSFPQLDAAGQTGRARGNQVCVYKDINFQGTEQCFNAGDEIGDLGAQKKSISSIRISGRVTVTAYDERGFRGQSVEFTSDVADLGRRMIGGRNSWSDQIESLRISEVSGQAFPNAGERRNPGDLPRNQSQQPRNGICVYDRPNYEGRSECWNQGQNISDLDGQGSWSGQISSIRLFGRSIAVLYEDTGYRGESFIVDRDMPNFAAIGSRGNGNGRGRGRGRGLGNRDYQISSLQVQGQRQR